LNIADELWLIDVGNIYIIYIDSRDTAFNLCAPFGNNKRTLRWRIIFQSIFHIYYTKRRRNIARKVYLYTMCVNMCKIFCRNGAWRTGIRRPRRPHHSALASAMRMRSLVCVGCVNAARSTGIGRRNAALYHFAAMYRWRCIAECAVGSRWFCMYMRSALCTQRCRDCQFDPFY